MGFCRHKCEQCNEEWICDFPYFSNHDYFEEAVTSGSYCNAYCPNCEAEKREELKELFETSKDPSYLKKNFKNSVIKEKSS